MQYWRLIENKFTNLYATAELKLKCQTARKMGLKFQIYRPVRASSLKIIMWSFANQQPPQLFVSSRS